MIIKLDKPNPAPYSQSCNVDHVWPIKMQTHQKNDRRIVFPAVVKLSGIIDEITASGLTVDKASWLNAPLVEECFMNLESKYVWEKEIAPGDDHVLLCLEIIGGHIDDEHLSDRIGENGILYNIHHQQKDFQLDKWTMQLVQMELKIIKMKMDIDH